MSSGFQLGQSDRIATARLDAPPLNILDLATMAELIAAIDDLAKEETIACLVIRGSQKAFSAGVSVADHTRDKIETMLDRFHSLLSRLEEFPAPVLAAIEGHCLGGGMELAMACDLRVASDRARFSQPEIRLACFPPYAAVRYPKQLGAATTADLIMTGRTLAADQALAAGVVSRVFDAADFDLHLSQLLEEIMSSSTPVLRLAKQAMRSTLGRSDDASLAEAERIYCHELTRLHDLDEGLAAFTEKRPPKWQHS